MSKIVRITIDLHPNGDVHFNGPLSNRALCYQMLGMAHEIVLRNGLEKSKQEGGRILTPQIGIKRQ